MPRHRPKTPLPPGFEPFSLIPQPGDPEPKPKVVKIRKNAAKPKPVKIRKDVAKPKYDYPRRSRGQPKGSIGKTKYPWHETAVGGSFFVERAKIHNLSCAAREFASRHGTRYQCRTINGGVKVTRIK